MTDPITIRPLEPDLLGDYLRFFDGPAFADNPHWASCYCYFHHHLGPDDWDSRTGAQNREAVAALIRGGRFHGFLAYRGMNLVGWCNAAPKGQIPRLRQLAGLATNDTAHVGSIVCFVVAKDHRRSGVAAALLKSACDSFAGAGLTIAEAYPRRAADDDASNYHGPLELYRRSGFDIVHEFDSWYAVRKPLGAAV
jgi:GNAT superfamily N-acetyltransferase